MASKVFQVGDVLPATTQLRISWNSNIVYIPKGRQICSDNGSVRLFDVLVNGNIMIQDSLTPTYIKIYDAPLNAFQTPYTNYNGSHPYCDIDTFNWDINSRTIFSVSAGMNMVRWEDLNAPPSFNITFNSNGGSSVSQISNATQLPSELPIPTKARNIFVGWYYDSTLKQKAKPNDMINTNVTLYAKWYDSLSAFYTDIANLIREFENSGDNIKVTDFADRLRALLESV